MPDSEMKQIIDIMSRYNRFGAYKQESHFIKPLAEIVNQMPALDKLRGFLGFSGTFNIKLTWNTDPTMLGMFLVAYTSPGCSIAAGAGVLGQQTFYSGCPHVIVNIAETTSAILSIPYVGEANVIPMYPTSVPMDTSRQFLGHIHIIPIVALASSVSPNAINMSLFNNIENLKTYAVQPRVAQVQASAALAGIVEATKKSKIVSSSFGSISKYLNKNQDDSFISGLSRVGGWAFGAASKISDLLGWSKPLDVTNLVGVVQLPYRDLYTCDTTFVGAKTTQNYDQGISDLDLSGRSIDEMTISSIVDRPNIIPNVQDILYPDILHMSMKKIIPEGTLIGTVPINPTQYYTEAVSGGLSYETNTQISYLSKLFEFWRGAIRFYVRPVCTKFHSARIRVVFIPGPKITNTESIVNTMQYTYAHVVDIRDPTTYDIEVPFVHQFPWSRTLDSPIGHLYFLVENPLIAPENVSDTIVFPLFVAGGSDFELAVPCIKHIGVPSPVLNVAVVESNNELANIVNIAPNATSDSVTAHSMSIGDPVRSMRSVLKRFWPAASFGNEQTKLFLSSEPSARSVASDPTTVQRDMTMYTTWLYGFHRGGMRWYAQNYYPARISTTNQVTSDSFTETGVGVLQDTTLEPVQTITIGATDTAKIEIPYYNSSVCVNHWLRGNTNSSGLIYDYWTGATTGSVFCRALADDFSFGFLVGAPSIVTSSA